MGKSLEQFRKRVIRSSLFPAADIGSAIERLGFLQADPIRCPARAQDLILRQRVRHYKAGDLERHYADLEIEECFLFAYGFAPKGIWNVIYPKSHAALSASEKKVLHTMKQSGPVDSRGLEKQTGRKRVTNYWGGSSRQAKMCLESLHDSGLVRVAHREKGIRFYETAETPRSDTSEEDRFKEVLLVALRSIGPTTQKFLLSEIAHFRYLVDDAKDRRAKLQELIDAGKIRADSIGSVEYLSACDLTLSRTPLDRVRILAPFDPIVRDRARFEHLWGWEYRFEAYVPSQKRKLGYYAMPVLWRDDIIGWANANISQGKLFVEFGYTDQRPSGPIFKEAAEHEAAAMAKFLGLDGSAVRTKL
ncbi:MAG: crosslink repair DNA glycosylase YcaQ family protein [Verrucomicrobiota bacterium]